MQQNLTLTRLAGLLLVFLVYSSANIFMKLSSSGEGLSSLFYLGCAFGVLGVYACLWQQILKFIPLTTAFMFKSITVLYGMFFAWFLFKEDITLNNMLGAILIVTGIIVLGWRS